MGSKNYFEVSPWNSINSPLSFVLQTVKPSSARLPEMIPYEILPIAQENKYLG